MLDTALRKHIEPGLKLIARKLAAAGLRADQITLFGFALGIAGAGAIASGYYLAALPLILLNRLCDGLDGALARLTEKTDFGGFLDIVLDFFFYGAIPFAFAFADPVANSFGAAALLVSFYANGSVFLAFAIFAERRAIKLRTPEKKSFHYLAGLAEGAETILIFSLFCLFPGAFPYLSLGFAALCGVSAISRVILVAYQYRIKSL